MVLPSGSHRGKPREGCSLAAPKTLTYHPGYFTTAIACNHGSRRVHEIIINTEFLPVPRIYTGHHMEAGADWIISDDRKRCVYPGLQVKLIYQLRRMEQQIIANINLFLVKN